MFAPLLLSLTIVASTASDSSGIDSVDTSPVVVSASRWEERASTVSREILSVTPLQITRQQPPTTADALATTGLVHVQKSQLGGGSPMLRGYAANSVLLVIDGVRMNNAIYRSGNLQNSITVDAAALDGMEVLMGPGSVQYGSDAMGGVMVFTTRRPTFAEGADNAADSALHVGGSTWLRYASAANLAAGSVAIDLGSADLASSTVISVSSFGDLRGGASFMPAYPDFGRRPWYVQRFDGRDSLVVNTRPEVQVGSGYDQLNVLQNLHWRLDDRTTLEYGGIFTTSSNVPRYDRLIETRNGGPRFAEWYYGPQLFTMHSLTYRRPDATITASMQYTTESRHDRPFQSDLLRSQNEAVWVGSINADFRQELTDNADELDLYYGAEVFVNDVQSQAHRTSITTGQRTPTGSRYPDGGSTVWSGAGYAQLRYGVSDRLTLAGGLRATWYDLRSSIGDTTLFPYPFTDLSLSTGAVTGSIGATWKVSNVFTVHGNAASGFRAPNVDDIAKVFETGPGLLVIPNANLGPEYVRTIEAGLNWRIWRGFTADVNGYTSFASDAIEVRPSSLNGADTIQLDGVPTAIFANTNVGQARISGLSVRVQGAVVDRLHVLATAAYNYGINPEDQSAVSHIPPAFGTLQLEWRQSRWSVGAQFWWAAAQTFRQIPMDDEVKVGINYTADGTPAWRRLDLSARVQPLQDVEVNILLENLFDLNYHTFGSGISAPGRNLSITARYLW
ncbi:MAG: TonB-dependent receptor [Candidatus Kapaibacteriota bacterium]